MPKQPQVPSGPGLNQVANFDFLKVGMQWRSTSRTLMEADLAWACMTSTDWHPIHVDVEYAAATQHGQRIFQGTYGTHLAVGMAIHLPPLGNAVIGALGLNGWKYCAPLFVNDTVYVDVDLISKRPTGDGKRAVLERRIRLMKSDGTLAQEGVLASLIHRD